MANHRYAGISPYMSEQKDVFFGRDEDIEELYEKILLEKQVLLYAKSGIGKSSLLNAGVIPKLIESEQYSAIKVRFTAYNEKDFVSPVAKLVHEIKELEIDLDQKGILEEIASDEEQTLWYYFKKIQLIDENIKPILIFDQFEELFSYPKEYIEEFKNQLSELLKPEVPGHFVDLFAQARSNNRELMNRKTMGELNQILQIKTVYIIRSDRLSDLNSLRNKIPNIQKSYYELLPLNKDQARDAIVKPAQMDGDFESEKFEYEKEAIEKILSFLTQNYTQTVETTQLQIICHRIETNNISKGNGTVKASDIPDFKNIFFDFYSNAIGDISNQHQANARKLIEDEMIRDGQRISLDGRLCADYIPDEELQKLVNNHLLRAERNTVGGFSYELSHDTLVEPIHEAAKARRQKEEMERLNEERAAKYKELEKKRKRQLRFTFLITTVAIIALIAFIYGLFKSTEARREIEKFNELYNAQLDIIFDSDEDIINHYWLKGEESLNQFNYRQARIELLMAIAKYSWDTPPETVEAINNTYNLVKQLNESYKNAIDYFYNNEFALASEMFSEILYSKPNDSLTLFYVKACGDFKTEDMVLVEGGSFEMGYRKGGEYYVASMPLHQVTLSNYYISKYEVTNAQYARFLNEYLIKNHDQEAEYDSIKTHFISLKGNEGIEFKDEKYRVVFGYENHPVNWVTWYGANAFCEFYGLSLPTEAQWEFAAKGGNSSQGYYYSGSNEIELVAEYFGTNAISTAPVAKKLPNELGLHFMSGNVWEWCSDWYDTYDKSAQVNPTGPVSGNTKVSRGGGWSDETASFCEVSNRHTWYPHNYGVFIGFRVAYNPKSEDK